MGGASPVTVTQRLIRSVVADISETRGGHTRMLKHSHSAPSYWGWGVGGEGSNESTESESDVNHFLQDWSLIMMFVSKNF